MKLTYRILGIVIVDRTKASVKVQEVLTRYGCSIKTRLGLHEVSDDFCSTSGLILLELTGPKKEQDMLEKELKAIEGIKVDQMSFN